DNERKRARRVDEAARAALSKQAYVRTIVLLGIGWLTQDAVDRWRKGQLTHLERAVQANLSRISAALKFFRSWAANRGLVPSETAYVRKTHGRPAPASARVAPPGIERAYRTHWVSLKLREATRVPMG